MTGRKPYDPVDDAVASEILRELSSLLADFRDRDIALQNAVSDLVRGTGASAVMHELQHVDLVTQSHDDLARLLAALADYLGGTATEIHDLRTTLKLQSLQNRLVGTPPPRETSSSGDVSLF